MVKVAGLRRCPAWYSMGMSVMGYFHQNVPGVVNRQARELEREQLVRQGCAPGEAETRLAGYADSCNMDPVLRGHCQVVECVLPKGRGQLG
jgi:hypothetical protein